MKKNIAIILLSLSTIVSIIYAFVKKTEADQFRVLAVEQMQIVERVSLRAQQQKHLAEVAQYGQDLDARLDVDKLKDCELFPQKEHFDENEMLRKITEVDGKEVTVYFIKPGKNRIISTYSGVVVNEMKRRDSDNQTVFVRTSSDIISFPANNRYYKIYLAECANK